jgi:hypothetical protein
LRSKKGEPFIREGKGEPRARWERAGKLVRRYELTFVSCVGW